MVDPFESLRHDAEASGSTAIDPRFRADLLAEARRHLTSTSTDSIRPRATADTPTPIPMEPMTMLAKQPKKSRPLMLAAACAALIGAGAVAVLTLQGNDDAPAITDTLPSPTAQTTPPTTAPSATPSVTQPSTPPDPQTPPEEEARTTLVTDPDDALAQDLLLLETEFHRDVYIAWTPLGFDWDADQAAALPACAPYVESVFRPISEHDDYRVFQRDAPFALAFQYTSVLASEEQATSVMNAMAEPAFLQCGIDYRAADGSTYCCAGEKSLPEPLGFVQPSAPPFEAVGDQLNFYTWATTWLDANGVEHGRDDRRVGAFVRVGRAIVYVDGLIESSDTEPIVTPDGFHTVLANVVARTEAVMSGGRYEPPTPTIVPGDVNTAGSMLLPTNDYGDLWIAVWGALVDFDPQLASDIPECQPFMASVFDVVAAAPRDVRSWQHIAPLSSYVSEYVAVLSDAEAARTTFAAVNSAGFAACAAAYNAPLPGFFEQQSEDSPGGAIGDEIAYRRYPNTWTDHTGQIHEEIVLDAVIRVDRVLLFIETVNSVDGEEIVSEDEFHEILVRAVDHANEALT